VSEHPELAAEQAYVDRAYAALHEMRADAARIAEGVLDESTGGTHQARYERDVFVQTALQRLHQLDIGDHPLVFGRMDRADGDRYYLGRVAVSGPDRSPLVVDWRAPVAEAFYRATGREPMDLTLRRHFSCESSRIVGISDERFGSGEDGDGVDLGLAGPGALLAALERTRTGRMRDIVATVQREQDEVIRAPLPGILIVQGGPGTGKTAVALHRAAYLLFTYRRHLSSRGILVVGPNDVFLRYIDQVLPALGESGAGLTTIAGMVPGVTVRGSEPDDVARLKGDARMARVIKRAVQDRQRPLRRDTTVPFGRYGLTLSRNDSEQIVRTVRRGPGSHNRKRRQLVKLVLRRLYDEYRKAADAELKGGALGEMSFEELASELGAEPEMRRMLDRMWPALSARELLHDLFSSRPLLASAGRGVLAPDEAALLHRAHSESLRDIVWTLADMPLLDEATSLLGPKRGTDEDEGPRTYGHIVVDEAQDLSPMALRMLARRAPHGSMTLVGDIAQATGHHAPDRWDEVLRHLPTERGIVVKELGVSYRTPAEILELANRVLRRAAPHLRLPEPVRSTGIAPEVRSVSDVGAEAAGIAKRHDPGEGTLAIVCSPTQVDDVMTALADAGVAFGDAVVHGLQQSVTVVREDVMKGLEFDEVVVVEPARLVRESPQGDRALYVALTRSTRRLWIVHAEPLPDAMGAERPD